MHTAEAARVQHEAWPKTAQGRGEIEAMQLTCAKLLRERSVHGYCSCYTARSYGSLNPLVCCIIAQSSQGFESEKAQHLTWH